MAITVKVDDSQVQVSLGELRGSVTDLRPLLSIAGEVMRGSIATTFREEGSPAGSWPRLALSTLRNKAYTTGHKLLILSGCLFGSITYTAAADTLTIGTNVVYAAVQQLGSRDFRGNFTGPLTAEHQAAYEAERVGVGEHGSSRLQRPRYGTDLRTGKDGITRRVHIRMPGPRNRTAFNVREHLRHQNIPPRPYLVFRPEDPGRIVSAFETYFGGKAVRIGMVGAR
jgi:phage gpG-like protein